jgi:putative membrane protein insertion efficiency factor
MLRAIDWYQRAAEGRPSPCRFTPSCSEYAREAVEVYGAGRGGWLAVRRLSRCRPFGKSGYDPVPEACAGGHAHPSEPLSSSSTHHSKVI